MAKSTLKDCVSTFGKSVREKLSNAAISGSPEDQLRAPLETLIREIGALGGLADSAVQLIGETSLSHLKIRPDYAVSVNNALAGFIEVKAPGKGCDPRKFSDPHDKAQWAKLKSLPNLLYTDGNGFTLWRNGELAAKPVTFEGDIETAGAKLEAPDALLGLLTDYLTWHPEQPRNAKHLAEISARLCRLLRDEVIEQMEAGNASLIHLRDDWRMLLFPNADDAQFADGYAQAVTFGLLMARAFDIPLKDGIDLAALKLRKSNTLIGTALNLLTEDASNQEALKTSLGTLLRVLDVVDWHALSKDKPEAWLYFYEDFLDIYDRRLKKLTGSYYTPPEVVSAMVRLVDEALRGPLFERPIGLASQDVTIADPAVGTGTFLLGVLRRIAENVEKDQGPGAVTPAMTAAASRIFGFELQFGPFAVAQLRLLAEMRAFATASGKELAASDVPNVNLYITDTLGNPFVEEEQLPQIVEAVARSRREANRVKRGQPITVVIGNPPYKEKAEGRGSWIEQGSDGRPAPMERWRPPKSWGVGAHTKHLKNLYIYFWRWATLKVFDAGLKEAANIDEKDEEGLICFITVAGFLNGPGFEKMRDDLRRTCSAIWVIDCSPEGHQPEVATRIFEGVQQPVCIVIAARQHGKDASAPARVLFRALPAGKREAKFGALNIISLADTDWVDCPTEWRAPFLPEVTGLWRSFPPLQSLFDYDGSGVMPGRTWIIAPDRQTLEKRWQVLVTQKDATKKEELFHPHQTGDKTSVKKSSVGLAGHEYRGQSVATDTGMVIAPAQYAFRSFDRQWIIPDNRLINRANPALWNAFSKLQMYITAPEDRAITNGPAVSLTSEIPDLHHYHGRGGRVYPLWADAAAKTPNIRQDVLGTFAEIYGLPVSPDDVFAYIAAVMAHPAFTARFRQDLVRPGLRLPVTADAALFTQAVALGREIVWLHCYGERFTDAAAGRPKGPPRMTENTPFIPSDGTIPPAPEPLPEDMHYDAAERRLHVGKGYIENVTPEMWAYEISGKQVVWQWFSYRRLDRSRPIIGDRRPPSPLEKIQPEGWLPEYTTDLLNLLNVLGRLVSLESAQAALLQKICDGELASTQDMSVADNAQPAA
ncbi:hypothetical protein BH10PSE7_BH10PSE7_11680 [soil metagenome]